MRLFNVPADRFILMGNEGLAGMFIYLGQKDFYLEAPSYLGEIISLPYKPSK